MKNSSAIQQAIINKIGFVPPFFLPAIDQPELLENLWNQTVLGYLENPLPHLFKEKIAALLARYCPVQYCLFCHTSTLSPLGMSADMI